MTNRRYSFQRTAVAALAGLAVCSFASTTLGAVAGIGGGANDAPVTNGNADQLPFVGEQAETNNTFETRSAAQAPNDKRFAIRGELIKSDEDGMCRDVDFYRVEGLSPFGEYVVGLNGPASNKGHVGLFNDAGELTDLIGPGIAGKIFASADETGGLFIAVSATDDDDFDGNDDELIEPHGLCSEYTVLFEQVLFADVNNDAIVDINDVRAMLSMIGATDAPLADLTHDGIVDEQDLRILADIVTDKRARKLADKNATKIEKRNAKAARKAAKQAAKDAARRGVTGNELKALIAENAVVLSATAPSAEPQTGRRR